MEPATPTERFSNRVETYVKYRPGYPDAVISLLQETCGLTGRSVVADVGAGTGIFTEDLLKVAGTVFAIEPNEAMRQAMVTRLGGAQGFHALEGSAEATGLEAGQVDLIVAAQAFHWFRPAETRREWLRIGKPHAKAALIWNERLVTETPFLQAYEDFLKTHATDYAKVDHRNVTDTVLGEFFGGAFERKTFPNEQVFDLEGLLGRAFSSSYIPGEDDPAADEVRSALKKVFHEHETGGHVSFLYRSAVVFGRLGEGE